MSPSSHLGPFLVSDKATVYLTVTGGKLRIGVNQSFFLRSSGRDCGRKPPSWRLESLWVLIGVVPACFSGGINVCR